MAACPMAWARWLFPVPGGPKNKASSWRAMKAPVARSKIRLRFIFLLKLKSKFFEAPLWVAKLGLLGPSLQQAIAATSEFVGDQAGKEVDGGHGLGLSLVETGFEHGG